MLAFTHDNPPPAGGTPLAQATVTKTIRVPETVANGLAAAAKATGRSENNIAVNALVSYLAKLAKDGKVKIEVL